MKFKVLKTEVEKGKPYNNTSCPVALALRRALKLKSSQIRVFYTEIQFGRGLNVASLRTTDKVRKWIGRFDSAAASAEGALPSPLEFTIPDAKLTQALQQAKVGKFYAKPKPKPQSKKSKKK